MPKLSGSHRNPVLLLTLSLVFSGFAAACSDDNGDNGSETRRAEREEVRPVVIFDRADDQPLYHHIETQGRVEPLREVKIYNRLAGFIENNVIRDGRRVSEGDTILALDDREWQMALEDARNALEKAASDYRIERDQRLRGAGTDTLSEEMDRFLRNFHGYSDAQVQLRRAELNMSYASVVAPFAGHIHTRENFTRGQYLSAGTELGRLVDQSQVRVRFDMLESELADVGVGMTVELETGFGYGSTGVVEAVSPVVDGESKTGQVVALFDNPDGQLRGGMTVDGRVLISSVEGRSRIPRAAMLMRDNRPLLFRLSGDMVEWVYIDPVAVTSEWVVINDEEISPGDTLAVDQHFAISHMQRVNPRFRF
ncbi:MAG: efflux RND transporter periplasmic adaptor subunit [Cyclonatronaceae bacterium]